MKPIPAIVEPAAIDVDLIAEQIIVAASEERQADASGERHEGLAASARATAQQRRLEIGRLLTKARGVWPERGKPRAGVKGSWAEFLARVGMTQPTAWNYMELHKAALHPRANEGAPQTRREAGLDNRPLAADRDDEPVDVIGQERDTPPFRQMAEGEWIQGLGRLNPDVRRRIMDAAGLLPAPPPALELTPDPTTANVHGGSGEKKRGSYCTPKKWAHAVGLFDVDPFSNPRSHIAAADRCMLENGGDGLVVGEPGSYRVGADGVVKIAAAATRVWIQPDYRIVLKAIAHYGHTRFTALLRFAPDTRWFRAMWPRVAVIAVPMERLPFETPEGVELANTDEGEDAGAPFPHVLYYTDPRDITDEIAQMCILLNRYEALRLVR